MQPVIPVFLLPYTTTGAESTSDDFPEHSPQSRSLALGILWLCFTGAKEHYVVNYCLSLKSNLFLTFPCVINQSTTTDQTYKSSFMT